jgi:hypothetical protein
MRRGIAAEYGEIANLVDAAQAVRACGVTGLEAYTPFAVPELDRVLDARRSPMAIITAIGALGGVLGAYGLQWLLNAYLYPVLSGGRPPHMPLAYVIITIEMGFLFGGLSAFFGCVAVARLGRLWQPIFDIPGFESETRAAFWLAVDADDPRFEVGAIDAALRHASATRVERFGVLEAEGGPAAPRASLDTYEAP